MVRERERRTLEQVLQTSGRLRHEDQAILARALGLILQNRAAWPDDPEEALVEAVASIVVIETSKRGRV